MELWTVMDAYNSGIWEDRQEGGDLWLFMRLLRKFQASLG